MLIQGLSTKNEYNGASVLPPFEEVEVELRFFLTMKFWWRLKQFIRLKN